MLMGLLAALLVTLGVAPLHLRPAAHGELLGWLVIGPFPNAGALQGHGQGFATDYLGGEAEALPAEGDQRYGGAWRLAFGDAARGIDLRAMFDTDQPAIAYCYTTLDCPRPTRARLKFGSDDGAKVYVNGRLIYERDVKRGLKRDEEDLPVDLVAGANRLLFKIEQYDGGWGLLARIVDDRNEPIPDLHEILQVDRFGGGSPYPRWFAGRPGSLDVATFFSLEADRMQAQRLIDHLRARIGAPEALEEAISGAQAAVATSGDADAASERLGRASDDLRNAYASSRAPLVRWASYPGPLVPTDPAHEDYVRVLTGGRYFAHADGKPFIPLGGNHNPDWPELEQANPRAGNYDPARTEQWFANLEAHGVNVVRLMVETPPSGNLENPVGTFVPEHLIWLDNIFAAARKHAVKLWITPYDTFWMSLRKETSPYWSENGGPIVNPIDFLTKPTILDDQKRRIRYLIDRYGNTGTVFAWEVMNEIDLWWNASPEQIRAWTDQMVEYVRAYERKRWGRNHLVTISFADAEPKGLNAQTAFRRPDLDFATMHLYLGASRGPNANQIEQAGIDFAGGVRYARRQIRDNRPVLDGESGPIDHWIADMRLDDAVFHDMSWEHLMAGGAGSGTRWPYRNPHRLTAGMLATLQSMRTFCDQVDWKAMTGPETAASVSKPEGGRASIFATAKGAIAWLRLPAGARDRAFTISYGSGRHAFEIVRALDVRANRFLDIPVHSDPASIKVDLPAGVDEIALFSVPHLAYHGLVRR